MRAEFFGGPLDGDVADLVDHGEESGFGQLIEVRIPTDANTNRYAQALTARDTGFVHVYKRGKTGPNGVIRLDYDGWAKEAGNPVGG